MRLVDFRNRQLKDTGDESLNEVYRQLTSIGMGNMDRQMDKADLYLYKTQFDNNILAFLEGVRYAAINSGVSQTEVGDALRKLKETLNDS